MNQEFNDYYESNLKLLEKNHPAVWKQIKESSPEASGEISCASNGKPNLIVTNTQGKSVTLHNDQDPEKESLDFLDRVPMDHTGFIAILGLGLCYSALKILKKRPHLQILALFELEPGIFIQALRHTDLSPILKDSRLILGIGKGTGVPETLAKASRTLQLESSNIFHHLPSFEYNNEGYNLLKDDLFSHLNSLNVGGTTTRVLGKAFLNNRFKHISTIHHHLLLEHIGDRFDGVPAILVAGGPSLDKNIHLLKQSQETAVIIAVDTVLPTLLKNDVRPHFLTCIDPNDLTFEKFADLIPQISDVALILASWVNPKTPKIFPADKIFWTFTAKPMEAWLNSLLGGSLLTGGASTVAHLNLIAAHMLGCDPIIFIGQDLAYPSTASSSHAKGTVLQGTAPTEAVTNHVEGETVMGINGEILRTNRSFLSMKEFFESAIASSAKTHINATQGGANIEGTDIMSLKEAMDKYCSTRTNISKSLKQLYQTIRPINPDKMLTEFDRIIDKANHLQKAIKKSNTVTSSVFKEILKLKKKKKRIESFGMLPLPQRKKINKIDKFHKDLDSELEIWKILEEITMDGLKESERQKQDISILKNDPEKYIEWLAKNLERLTDINRIRQETLTLLSDHLSCVTSFHKKESVCLARIKKGSQVEENKLKLARLYIESENYYLAKPLLEELNQTMPGSGDICFYLGCLSAQSNMLEDADHYFKTAMEYKPELAPSIDEYLKKLADRFLSFAHYFKTQPGRELSIKYMVQKGLKYYPDHNRLKKELEVILKKDLESFSSDSGADNARASSHLINDWYRYALDHKNMFDSLSAALVGKIFLYQAKLFLSQKEIPDGLASLEKGLEYTPDDPEIHTILIETLFTTGDFNTAIASLDKAIKIDSNFAAYWETIGDSLESEGLHEDAVMAFERCYTHQPGNINLLKKIGDAYLAADQLEAAKEAYEQLKSRMEGLNRG